LYARERLIWDYFIVSHAARVASNAGIDEIILLFSAREYNFQKPDAIQHRYFLDFKRISPSPLTRRRRYSNSCQINAANRNNSILQTEPAALRRPPMQATSAKAWRVNPKRE
jgi:hypothetical protein